MIPIYATLLRLWSLVALAVAGMVFIAVPAILFLAIIHLLLGHPSVSNQPIVIAGSGILAIAIFICRYLRYRLTPLSRKVRKHFPGAKQVNQKERIWVYPGRIVGAHAMPGPWHGAVILSSATLNLPPSCIKWIVSHEQAHLRHRDTAHFMWRAATQSSIRSYSTLGHYVLLPFLLIPLIQWVAHGYLYLCGKLVRASIQPLRLIHKLMDWGIEYRADREATERTGAAAGILTLSILLDLGMGGIDLKSLIGISSHPPMHLRIKRLERLQREP